MTNAKTAISRRFFVCWVGMSNRNRGGRASRVTRPLGWFFVWVEEGREAMIWNIKQEQKNECWKGRLLLMIE